MGTLSEGDRVKSSGFGDYGTVTKEYVNVAFDDGSSGIFQSVGFTLVPRRWKEGDYARVITGVDPMYDGKVVYIFEDDGDPEDEEPYWCLLANGDEVPFNADELIPWMPIAGERVVSTDDDEEVGVILGLDSAVARVQWDDYPVAQNWLIAELEPAFEDEDEDEFEVGDTVVYSNPIFSSASEAEVIEVSENVIWVNFEPGTAMKDGAYPKDFFSRKAA